MTGSTFETPRLILRPHTVVDFDNIVKLWSDPKVVQFIAGNRPLTREECWQRLLRYHGLWSALGFGYFAVIDKKTGAFLGEVGLADFHRDIVPSMEGFSEAGWALVPGAWGKGFAQEALIALFDWYAATPKPRPVTCIIDMDNLASIRLAEAVGFKLKAETTYHNKPCKMFSR